MWRDWFARAVLIAVGLSFIAVGVTGLFAPAKLMDPVHIRLGGINGLSEVRAAYGGVHAAFAMLLFAGAAVRRYRTTGLIVAAVFLTGLAAGRCVSLAIDGPPGLFVWRLFATEFVGANLAIAALLLNRR